MTIIRRYTSTYPTVSHMVADGAFTWIAYEKNSSGVCHLEKVSSSDLDLIYFDISITANEILDMTVTDDYIYVLFDNSSTYLATGYSTTSPTTTTVNFSRPAGLLEEPIALAHSVSDDRLNVLIPGASSATNTIVYRFNDTNGVLIETIAVRVDDIHIVDARSITVDDQEDIWIATHTIPTKLVRMYFASGGWHFAFKNIE